MATRCNSRTLLKMCFVPDSILKIPDVRGDPKTPEFIYKKCVFTLRCLNFSHRQSTLHLMQSTYWDVFSTDQNSFWTHQFWWLLVLLSLFVLPLPQQQNIFLLGLIFHPGKKKIVTQGKKRWIGRVGQGGYDVFALKLLNTSRCGRCGCKPPIGNGQMCWKSLQK